MTKTQSRARLTSLAAALLVIAVMVTACGAPSAPAGTPQPATAPAPGAQATSPAATQPAPGSGPTAPLATADPGSQEPGASANLNPAARFTTHYKGDPNAPVVIIEVSDFQ